ncbi:T1SS-143 domain-containing protein, partial [Tardiphaga robiniae]|nr:T1SS-143 domain-containing protein [Tardiphaga robiniae]
DVADNNVAHGDAGALFSAGADGVKSVSISGGVFQVVYKDANGFAHTESVTWGAGVQGTDGTTTFTATSAHYATAATLVIGADGSYTYTASAPVVQGTATSGANPTEENATIKINITVTDGDGDTAAGSLSVNVNDDTPTASWLGAQPVTESTDVAGVFVPSVSTGTLAFSAGADGGKITSVVYRFGNAIMEQAEGAGDPQSFPALTSHGVAVVIGTVTDGTAFGGQGSITLTGTAGGQTVFTLVVNQTTGAYTYTLSGPIDHPDIDQSGAADALTMVFDFQVTDGDGDKTAAFNEGILQIDIRDDAPTIASPTLGANLITNGQFLDNTGFGPPQPGWGGETATGSILGWAISGVGLERNPSGWYVADPVNGGRVVDLDASPGDVTIAQTLTNLTAGESYTLSFDAAKPLGFDATAQVWWNGVLVGTVNPSASGFQQFSFTFTAIAGTNTLEFREVGVADNGGTFLANVQLHTSASIVDEDALSGGNAGGQGDAPGTAIATGSLGIHWGADSSDTSDAGGVQDGAGAANNVSSNVAALTGRAVYFTDSDSATSGLQPAVIATAGATAIALTSQGQAVHYQVLENGTTVVGYTGTFIAGNTSNWVFKASLSDEANGSYKFTLLKPIDHPVGGSEDDISLSFAYTARDFDGDTVSGTFSVTVDDDTPVATAPAETVTVSEVGLPQVDAHTGFLNVSWGADKGDAKHLNFAKDSNGNVVGPVLHSNGVLLAYRVEPESAGSDNERLIAYRVGDPTQSAVFSITLYEPGNPYYTVALFGPLDHAPGSDPLTLGFTVTATDADGDSVNVPITVTVVDSVPVATAPSEAVTVSEVGLPLVDAHTGFLNVSWGADKGAAKHLNFAKDGNGVIIGPVLHSDGVLLAYRVEPESPGSDNERLVAYRVDDPSQSAVFSITLYEPGNPYYTVALFGPLDHAPGSDPLTLGFTVVATDADGDSLNVPISVVIVDSVPTAGPADSSSVNEHDLTTQIGFGQGFESATDGTSAGFFEGGVNGHLAIKASGVDGIDTKTHSGNYALVTQTAGQSAPFTRFGGNDSTFDGGFKASVDIYLDPNKIGSGEGFDYSVAVNKTDGSFLRDFIFHVGEDSQGNLHISANNNTGFDPLTDAQWAATTIKTNIPASAAGWYTFSQTFHDDGTGHLAVDMIVRDASGAVVFTQTIVSGDLISDTGGHRYGWFTNVDVANGIAIDNVSLTQHNDSTSATSVAGSLHINAGADGLGSLAFGGIVDGSAVTDSSNQAVTSGHQAVRYHVVDSHTLEGVTAGGQVIFTVTLDPATGGYNFVLAHQIDHPAPGTDGVALRFGYVVTDGDGDTASNTFTVTVGDDVPTIAGTATPVNLLTNGDFAGGIFAHTESWGQWATDDTGWKITGTQPGQTGVQLERIASGYLGVVTSNGHPMVDLAATPGDIAISQTINGLPPGQHYTLSFEIGASDPSSAGLEVYWNGQLVGTYHPGSTMAIQTLDLIAQTDPNNAHPANTVTFKEVGSADNTGTYLANVSLVQASSSLPVFHADIGEDGTSVVSLVSGTDFRFGADGPGSVAFDTAHATISTPTGTTLGVPTLSYDPVTGKLTVNPGWGFNGLSEGEIATLSVPFTVTDSDGDTKTGIYHFTIHGTNDAVSTSVGFPDSGTMTEYAETDPQAGSTADRTRFTDSSWGGGYNGGGFWIYDDQGDTHTLTVTPQGTGYLGHITAVVAQETLNDGAGFVDWQYHVTDADLNPLAAGETKIEKFTITVDDGHGSTTSRVITVTLVGTNDSPVISTSSAVAGTIIESGDPSGINEAGLGGSLDLTPAMAAAILAHPLVSNGLAGLQADPSQVHALLATIQSELGVNAGTAITIIWNALDDAYVAQGANQITINEAFTRLGIEYAAYVKAGGTPLLDVVAKYTTDTNNDGIPERLQSLHDNLLGNLSEAALQQRYGADPLHGIFAGQISAIDPDLLDRPYASGNAGSAGNTAAHAWDVANGFADQISGQLIATDVDHGATQAWTVTGPATYGTMAIDATGKWTYTLDNTLTTTQALAQGDSVQQTFTATVTDDHGATDTVQVTVTITGSNDAPVMTSGAASAVVFEAGGLNNVVTADVAVDHKFEPVRNVDGVADDAIGSTINTAADMKAVVLAVQSALGGGATMADAIAAVWDYLDDARGVIPNVDAAYYAQSINKGTVLLGLVYGEYLQQGGRPLLDVIVKYQPDGALSYINGGVPDGAPDRVQSMHDNLLGAVDTPSINDKFSSDQALLTNLKAQILAAGLTDRPIYSGEEGVANNALAWDQAHGFLSVASGQMTATDVDHGAVLTWSINGPATYGNMVINQATGVWSYTLDNGSAATQALAEGETKTQVFTATVTDEHGATANQTVTITIHGTNDAPVIHVDNGDSDAKFFTETNAGLTAGGTLSVTDVDVSDTVTANVLSVSASGSGIENHFTSAQLLSFLSLGASQVKAAGSTTGDIAWAFNSQSEAFDFLPNGWESKISYTIQVSDGHGGMDTHVVEIKIHGTNDAPVADLNGAVTAGNDVIVTAVEQMPQWILSGATLTDVDSTTMHSMKVTLTTQPDGLGVEGLSFNTSALDALAAAHLNYVYDATNGVLTVTGDASTATYQTIMRGVVYQYTGDAPSTGDRTVTVVVNDGLDNSITHTATVHVLPMNDAPSLAGPLAATVTEGGIHTLTAAELGYTDPDNTASEVVFHVSNVQHGIITNGGAPATSFTAAELAAGLIKFIHDGSEDSSTTFQVYVEDGNQDGSTPVPGTFTFTVDGVNDAPVITSAPLQTHADIYAAGFLDHAVTATTAADHKFEIDQNIDTQIGALLAATPADMHAVLVGVQAALGHAAGFADAIAAVWDYVDDHYSYYDTAINAAGVRLAIEYAKYVQDGGAPLSGVVVKYEADGTDYGTLPDRAQSMHDNLLGNLDKASIDDKFLPGGAGGSNGPPNGVADVALHDQLIAEIAAAGLSGRPYYAGYEDSFASPSQQWDAAHGLLPGGTHQIISGQLTATDADINDAGHLTWSLNTTASPYGTMSIDPATGVWSYDLDNGLAATKALHVGEVVTLNFVATVIDAHGASASQTVTITIHGGNDAPEPQNDVYTISEDQILTGVNVLANDTDPDGDTLMRVGLVTQSVSNLFSNPSIGANGDLTYTPDANESGYSVLTYQVSDGSRSSPGTITINVRPVADAAVLSASGGNEDTSFAVHIALGDTDGSEKATHIELSGYPAGTTFNQGSIQGGVWVIDNPAGIDLAHLTMTPPNNYNGAFNLGVSVTVVDHATLTTGLVTDTATSTGTIGVTVNAVNDLPVIVSDGGGTLAALSVPENTTAVTTVHATDVDSALITYSISGGDDAGKFHIDAQSGALTFNTAPDYENSQDLNHDNIYQVIVSASDGSLTATQTINVTVTDVNEVPPLTAVNDVIYTNSTGQIAVFGESLLWNDQAAQHGVLSIANGQGAGVNYNSITDALKFTQPSSGHDRTFEYHLTDGAASSTGDVTVHYTASFTPTSGNDFFISTSGNGDTLHLGDGNDVMFGSGSASSTIYGDGGNDLIVGGSGVNTNNLYGGSGDDVIYTGTGGNQNVWGDDGADTIYGSDSAGHVELHGGTGDDVIHSGKQYGTLIYGDDGNDLIYGVGVSAEIRGGSGNDTFAFDHVGWNADKVLDYSAADTIDLTALLGSAAGIAADGSNIGNFVSLTQSGTDISVRVDVTGHHNFDGQSAVILQGYGTSSNADIVNFAFQSVNAQVEHIAMTV